MHNRPPPAEKRSFLPKGADRARGRLGRAGGTRERAAMARDAPVRSCEQVQLDFRSEHPALDRRGHMTRAVMCDVDPPCVTELLFADEFYRDESAAAQPSRCRDWKRDSDWPTWEPHLRRHTVRPRARAFWDIMRLVPNRTVWLHGDSIQLQLCDAAMCSLMRDGVAPRSAEQSGPSWLSEAALRSDLSFRSMLLPNGARLLCSGIGPFRPSQVAPVLSHVDVAMFNHGLHYHTESEMSSMLSAAMSTLSAWQGASPRRRRLALWREASAQHFESGSYTPGAAKRRAGQPCHCTRLDPTDARQQIANLNVFTRQLERKLAARSGVGLVPFFNLTAPRHGMHRAHFCSYHDQARVGSCCDCTHFCYTPLFWDAFFGSMYLAVLRSRSYARRRSAGAPAAGAFR